MTTPPDFAPTGETRDIRFLQATDGPVHHRVDMAQSYELVAALHNSLGLTEPVDPTTRPCFGRPFQVLHADRFASALRAAIADPEIRALPGTGTVDHFADSTDFLGDLGRTRAAAGRG